MMDEFGDFLNYLTLLDMVLFSLLCAASSLKLLWLPPALQFLTVATLTIPIAYISSRTGIIRGTRLTLILSLLTALMLFQHPFDSLAVFFITSMIVAPAISGQTSEYLKAILAHTADAASTIIALENLSESNILLRKVMNWIGELPALIVFKTVVIGSILLYASRNLEDRDQKTLLRAVAILGIAMTARNMLLFL